MERLGPKPRKTTGSHLDRYLERSQSVNFRPEEGTLSSDFVENDRDVPECQFIARTDRFWSILALSEDEIF